MGLVLDRARALYTRYCAAVALCVEKGWLDYEALVAQYWTEALFFFVIFLLRNISVSDILAYRANIPCVDQDLTTTDLYDWNEMTFLLAAQKYYWKPGSDHDYHAYTIGFLVDELDSDFYNNAVGTNLPPIVPIVATAITCNDAFPMQSANSENYVFNDPRLHYAVLPAVNGVSNVHTRM
ncbi:unnamed protein product [Adineta ricciae]|uniref:Beta-lactamase-related domain-containing protein n=1 Tax=Adineta ricciae TaxID=249248 RepID=A0A815L9R4_ADIRI|nr:unnamed protein product [Adineta ricciae]CAF1406291.1 unnamed protein product [Adineta ricciae]